MEKTKLEQELEKHGSVIFRTKGISMEPFIHEDKTAVCLKKASEDINRWDVVLFRREKPETGEFSLVLHRVIRIEKDGTCLLCGDNQIFPEPVERENILGIMTGFYNADGFIDCKKNKKYLAYVKTWCIWYCYRFMRYSGGRFLRKIIR